MPRRARHLLALALTLGLALAPRLAAAAEPEPAAATAPVQAPAATPTAATDTLIPLAGNAVLISADRLERDSVARIVTGEGAVTIRHKETRLTADRAVYHEETQDIVADGNVVLDSGPDRLQGEHLELNLGTRVGFLEHAQGFVQTYYFTGERIEKRGPDRYFIKNGTFTTCEGVLPDWSFKATSTDLTIDEYLHAWNPTLRVKRLPVLYFPYAVFPIKRDRSTGLLIPEIGVTGTDGLVVRNALYWAPRDNFDATLGLDYLAKTGWGASGEMRYLLAPRTQGVLETYYQTNRVTATERWSVSTRNSQELPFGLHAEAEAFFQSDRQFVAAKGKTIEQRSSERTTSSFFVNRRWSSWDVALAGRHEVSLLTENRTTLTRFPELTVDRTSTRLFGTDLFMRVSAAAVSLKRGETDAELTTTRLHLSPELTWPVSLGSVARVIPAAGYAVTRYSRDTAGNPETRAVPFYHLTLEGPRPYRVWDLSGGVIERIKHLVEPRVSYVYTPTISQANIPQFDSVDYFAPANRVEYSLTNTLYAKERLGALPPAPPVPVVAAVPAVPVAPAVPVVPAVPAVPRFTTSELLWVKLSQSYSLDEELLPDPTRRFSAVEWDARTRPKPGLSLSWRGNYDVYGDGVGYQNVSLAWNASAMLNLNVDWRTTRGSSQDFLDLGANLVLGRFNIDGRSRYNLAEKTFVENRIDVKYTSQCWDLTFGYVRWPDEYQYTLLLSLKGVGTILRI